MKKDNYPPEKSIKYINLDKVNEYAYKGYIEFSKPKDGEYYETIEGCSSKDFLPYFSYDYFNMKIKKITECAVRREFLEYFYDLLDMEEIAKSIIHMNRMYRFTSGAYPHNNKEIYQVLYYKLYELTLKGHNKFIFNGNVNKIQLKSYKNNQLQEIEIKKDGNVLFNGEKFQIPIENINYFFSILKEIFSQRFINNFPDSEYSWKLKIYNEEGEKYEYISCYSLYYKYELLTDILKKILNNKHIYGFTGLDYEKPKNINILMKTNNNEETIDIDIENKNIIYKDKIIPIDLEIFKELIFINYNYVINNKEYFNYCKEYDLFKITFDFEKKGLICFTEASVIHSYSRKFIDRPSARLVYTLYGLYPLLYGLDKILKNNNLPTNLFGDYLNEEKEDVNID